MGRINKRNIIVEHVARSKFMPVSCQRFVEETEMKRRLANINMD
jgi:hypothetical protein